MKTLKNVLALGAIAAAITPFASATPITAGGNTVLANNNITVTPTSVLASVSGNLTAITYTGTYEEYVLADATNPYGAGDLTFVISVSNDATSTNGIEHVSLGSIDGGTTDGFAMFNNVNVGYTSGTGQKGTDMPLSVDETIYGVVEFNFTGADVIKQGNGTQYLVIQTAATNYTNGLLSVIDNSTDTVAGLVPAAATPEPSSLALLGTGLAGATAFLRRRRNSIV